MSFKFLRVLLLALVAATAVAPAGAAGAKQRRGPSDPVVVGTDADADWGSNASAGDPAIGNALGQELVEASIGMGEPGMVNFVIKVKSLPPSGGIPEASRYTWDFKLDDTELELDGKFTNYSRGTCDPTSGQCPPPRDPGLQPFLLRGNCTQQATPVTTLTVCEELAKIQGIFDAAAGTITIPVPMEAMEAKPGSKITGIAGTFGGTISAAPSAFVTSSGFPMDTLTTTKTYVIPKTKKKK